MLDVHEPEGEVRGWRGLLTHLFIITLGLLIALALEGAVEWIHHRNLAREARHELQAEFGDNEQIVRKELAGIDEQQKQAAENMAALDEVKGQASNADFRFRVHTWNPLSRSAWDTARETGAFEYMDYGEVDRYAKVVDLENEFMIHQDRLVHSYSHGVMVARRIQLLSEKGPKQDLNATTDQGTAVLLDLESELEMCQWVGNKLELMYPNVVPKLKQGSSKPQ